MITVTQPTAGCDRAFAAGGFLGPGVNLGGAGS